MPVRIKELKPKKKMPLPKPKPRHANPKHPMNTERTGPLRKAKGGPMHPVPRPFAGTNVPKEFMGSRPMQSEAAEGKRSKRGSIKGASTGMASGGSMKIKSGDTLSQIAKKNNISLRDLLSANPSIKNANKIRVGQSIKLPSTKMTGSSIGATRNPYKGMSKQDMADMDVKNKSAKRQQAATSRNRMSALDDLKLKAKPKPKAPPKLGKIKADAEETKKQKASRTGSIKSATTAENKRLDETRAKARKLRDSKKAANAQVEVGKGIPAMNKAASLNNVTSQKNRKLDDYREKMRRKVDRRMAGGKMKKVQGYNSGGTVRGAGAATKGKRFGRCG